MGEGNVFHKDLVEPASERLLRIQPGEEVLDIACGNGQFARRLTEAGARVVATDFSEQFIQRAGARSRDRAETFATCFRAGFVCDGLEEPAFQRHEGSRSLSWVHYRDIPPLLVARLRPTGKI